MTVWKSFELHAIRLIESCRKTSLLQVGLGRIAGFSNSYRGSVRFVARNYLLLTRRHSVGNVDNLIHTFYGIIPHNFDEDFSLERSVSRIPWFMAPILYSHFKRAVSLNDTLYRSFRAAILYLPSSLIVNSYRGLHEPRSDQTSTNELWFIGRCLTISTSRYLRILYVVANRCRIRDKTRDAIDRPCVCCNTPVTRIVLQWHCISR